MYMLYGFKSIQNRVRIISKVEKVLYSRAFFNYAFGFSRLSTKYETTKPPAMRVVSKKCYTK